MEKQIKKCEYFSHCGACVYLNEPYDKQLRKKKNNVAKAFQNEEIAADISDTAGMYYPYAYRNKIHLAVKRSGARGGVISIGFFDEDSDKIIDVHNCLLHDVWAEKLIKIVRKYVLDYNIEPYDNDTGLGILRYIAARCLDNSILVTLVVTSQNFPGKAEFFSALKKEFTNAGLYLNINKRTDNAVFDKVFIHKSGLKFLESSICGVKFSLHPASFLQINSVMAAKIYKKVIEIANGTENNLKNSRILDLYSGIGITSVLFAKNGAVVTAVESVRHAALAAVENAKINNVQNKITVINGLCEDIVKTEDEEPEENASAWKNQAIFKSNTKQANRQKIKDSKQNEISKNPFDIVFLDPARNGCAESVISTLLTLAPKKIIYLSCNPISLARDIKPFLKDYNIISAEPYDLFPHTEHVETLICLQRK